MRHVLRTVNVAQIAISFIVKKIRVLDEINRRPSGKHPYG